MTADALRDDPLATLIALGDRGALTVADLPVCDGQTWLVDGMLVVDSINPSGFSIVDLPVDGRAELIDGSMFVSPGADLNHQRLVAEVSSLLSALAPTPFIVLPGVNVIAGDGTLVMPDVAVVNPHFEVAGGLGVSPAGLALAIEVTSPSTRRKDMTIKRDLYAEWHVPYLLIDRKGEQVSRSVYGILPDWAATVLLQ